jgi:hypothetical protein
MDRDQLIATAVRSRKIAPAGADEFRRRYDADPQGVTHLLTAPVMEGGLMAGVAAAVAPFDDDPTEYPRDWLGDREASGAVQFEGDTRPTLLAPAAPEEQSGRVTFE